MRISELVEAVAPIGSTTDPVSPNGLPKSTPPTTSTPGQTPTTTPPGQTPPTGQTTPPAGQPAPTLGNQQPAGTGQPMGQQPAMKQGMQDTMTDLDKIAAQIVGLKQKQQQMQQQMQQPTR